MHRPQGLTKVGAYLKRGLVAINLNTKMATNKTFNVGYKVTNLKADTTVKPLVRENVTKIDNGVIKSATSLQQAINWALDDCFGTLTGNSQYPSGSKIEFTHGGLSMTLTDRMAKIVKGPQADFELKFGEIANEIIAGFVLKNPDMGTAYVRITDTAGQFKSVKTVTQKMVAAQLIAERTIEKEDNKWHMEDSMISVSGGKKAYVARQKRAQQSKDLRAQVQKLLGTGKK